MSEAELELMHGSSPDALTNKLALFIQYIGIYTVYRNYVTTNFPKSGNTILTEIVL